MASRKNVRFFADINEAVAMLAAIPPQGRNLQMPGDPHYQPSALQPYLGYDNRVGWQIIVAWFWMATLAQKKIMPAKEAKLLTKELLKELFGITTTEVTKIEREITKHDILALLMRMREILPKALHRWLHAGCTSYDVICTAMALQAKYTFYNVVKPQIQKVGTVWRSRITEHAETLQNGRTHLQTALPITAGCWLGVLHSRFFNTALEANTQADMLLGKFSGAVGTGAAMLPLFGRNDLESSALQLLGNLSYDLATQIVQPEPLARYYYELVLLSGALANLGGDVRHLQMSEVGEVSTSSSTSSTMSHKTGNPILAEQLEGMHESVRRAHDKVTDTLNSNLQRDLTGSSVMRSFPEIVVYVYHQLTTAERLLSSLVVNKERCRQNFEVRANVVVAELLHLGLQVQGVPDAHELVNRKIVPTASSEGLNLVDVVDAYIGSLTHVTSQSRALVKAWSAVSKSVKMQLRNPERYIGNAVQMARDSARLILK